MSVESQTMFYKKRCKRCKHKFLLKKPVTTMRLSLAGRHEWLMAVKVTMPASRPETVCERPKILAGEYTQRVSQAADEVGFYLAKIRRAENQPKSQEVADS